MSDAIEKVLDRAKTLVVPTRTDENATLRVVEKVVSKVEAAASGQNGVVGVFLGGSYAKGTWLPGDVDIDIFVKISTEVEEKEFEELGLRVGRDAMRGYRPGKMYAQHPYTEAVVEGFRVNVVPCYDSKPGEWRSAADRSLYHVSFVKQNLGDPERLHVRLLKKFMKAVGVYGAEIEKEGFSGYAAEVLTYHHKTLEETIRFFASFIPESPEQYFELLDPIDASRDLGKAISGESVAKMVMASRAFLEKPTQAYFKRVGGTERPRLRASVYALTFRHERLSEDTLWGELKRSARQVARHVKEQGFSVARFSAASDNASKSAILLLAVDDALSPLEERLGPPVELSEGASKFIEKNRRKAEILWVGEDRRLRTLSRRRVTSLSTSLEEVVKSRIDEIGVSTEIGRAMKKNGTVLRGERLRKEAAKEPWLKESLTRITSDSVGV